MLKNIIIIIVIPMVFAACGSSKQVRHNDPMGSSVAMEPNDIVPTKGKKKVSKGKLTRENNIEENTTASATSNIITTALSFEGTRYKFGGMDNKGMDCSGLVYTCYKSEQIELPRISRDMAKQGVRITLDEIAKGDLIFFITGKNKKTINHVGLVVAIDNGSIKFIHSTTSLGVIISSMEESYWKKAFIEVRRII
jgi:cell wall-associated NlpC family hydrolase